MSADAPKYTRAADLEVHETQDGLVVFNPATDRVHHLNFSAGALFELCDDASSAAELAAAMADLHSLDTPPLDDVETGLKQLVEEGVLVVTSAA